MYRASEELDAAFSALSHLRIAADFAETELGMAAAAALSGAGIGYRREARIGSRLRADFLLTEGTAIELKSSKPSTAALMAQLERYAACPEVKALLVAAPRAIPLPDTIAGKRVRMLPLRRLWGVAVR